MTKQYTGLNLDRDTIISSIRSFFDSKKGLGAQVSDDFKELSETQKRCEVETNKGSFYLDVYFKKDGKTTLLSGGGDPKFISIKEELCEYIAENCKKEVTQTYSRDPWFTAEKMSYEEVVSVVGLIKESDFFEKEIPHPEGNGYPTWKFKGVQNENLTITYYNKDDVGFGKLLLQGKPKLLFLESIEIITQLFGTDEISTKLNESRFFKSQIDDVIVQNDISEILPNAFDKLPSEQLKKTVKQAVIFKNFSSNFEDFTVYTFPAYRALEGHLRWILAEVSIDFTTKLDSKGKPMTTSFYMFEKESDDGKSKYILQSAYHQNVIDKYQDKKDDFLTYISQIYQILSDERNSYFHWKKFEHDLPLDDTGLIENEEVARAIIVNCLTQIENYYKLFY